MFPQVVGISGDGSPDVGSLVYRRGIDDRKQGGAQESGIDTLWHTSNHRDLRDPASILVSAVVVSGRPLLSLPSWRRILAATAYH
jgi:hypothetical protein